MTFTYQGRRWHVAESHYGAERNIRLVYLGHRFVFPSDQLLFLVWVFPLGLECEDEGVEAIGNS